MDIKTSLFLIYGRSKVRKRLRIALVPLKGRSAEGLKCGHRGHPRRDRSGKALTEKWAERLVFPRLNIASRPVIQKADSEEMLRSLGDWNRGSKEVGLADIERKFDFEIQRLGAAQVGFFVRRGRTRLAIRTEDGYTARKDRRRSSVISDRNVLVVGHQRLIRTKESPHPRSVVDRCVEVGIVRDFNGLEKRGSID
jgi:hypothetical protein